MHYRTSSLLNSLFCLQVQRCLLTFFLEKPNSKRKDAAKVTRKDAAKVNLEFCGNHMEPAPRTEILAAVSFAKHSGADCNTTCDIYLAKELACNRAMYTTGCIWEFPKIGDPNIVP